MSVFSFISHPTTSFGRSTLLMVVVGALALAVSSCVTPGGGPTVAETQTLYERPTSWRVVNEKQGAQLYQVNLQSRGGSGRILLGKMSLKSDIGDVDAYLNSLHTALVNRIRGQANIAPFAEDLLRWDNGMTGYRTKLRGELGDEAIIVEGITLSDGDNAYFHYGLFREADYEAGQATYQEVLSSLAPLRGAALSENTGLDIAQTDRDEPGSGQKSETPPDAYKSPKTHLGVVEWGTTREQIIAEYGKPIRKGQNAIGYRCNFLALDNCVVIYMFTYGQLTHGGYLIEDDFDRPSQFVSRYLKLTGRLARQYGRPSQSAAIWADPTYRDQGKMWGKALDQGHVVFGSVWNLSPTKLIHSLKRGRSGGVDHRILLTNDKLRQQLQQQGR
jgi:hypothetical protein